MQDWMARALACLWTFPTNTREVEMPLTSKLRRPASRTGIHPEANGPHVPIVPLDEMLPHLAVTRLRAHRQHLLNAGMQAIQSHLYAEPPHAWLGLGCAVKVKVDLGARGQTSQQAELVFEVLSMVTSWERILAGNFNPCDTARTVSLQCGSTLARRCGRHLLDARSGL
ncbi:hypothetical protein EV122DRAFT_277376 [Schizophyllum commune]